MYFILNKFKRKIIISRLYSHKYLTLYIYYVYLYTYIYMAIILRWVYIFKINVWAVINCKWMRQKRIWVFNSPVTWPTSVRQNRMHREGQEKRTSCSDCLWVPTEREVSQHNINQTFVLLSWLLCEAGGAPSCVFSSSQSCTTGVKETYFCSSNLAADRTLSNSRMLSLILLITCDCQLLSFPMFVFTVSVSVTSCSTGFSAHPQRYQSDPS